jgi:hypothetical protein
MKRLLQAIAVLSVTSLALAQGGGQVDPGIQRVIEQHYFAAHATGRGDPLRGVFLDEGRMMWVQEGQLRVRSSADYIAGFPGTPPADEAQRTRRVVFTDVTGDTAVAKVELDHPDVLLTDYFSLLRVNGDWKIVHKTFHRQPKAK